VVRDPRAALQHPPHEPSPLPPLRPVHGRLRWHGWCHRAGLHEFSRGEVVQGFDFGDRLPAGTEALPVGSICPDESALFIPWARAMVVADGVTRDPADGPLTFVPDFLLGDDPAAVKRGLCGAYARLLDRDFDHLIPAHGRPRIGGAKEALRKFIEAQTSE